MTRLRLTLVFLIAISLQLTVFIDIRVLGVAPELLALVAVLAGYFAGPRSGPSIAFAAGLLWDVYLPTHLGVSALIFAVVAYSIGSVEAGLFHDSRLQLAVVAALSTALMVIAYALSNEILGERGLIDMDMLKIAAVSGLFNAVLSVPASPLMRWALGPGPTRPAAAVNRPLSRG